MSDKVELLPCPFCGNPARLESNRDWHRIVVDHDERCAFLEPESVMVPATDDQLSMAITCWNRRTDLAQQPAPAVLEDLRARCAEILAWQKTGVLKGDALRGYARAQWYADEHNSLQMAEADTARQAYALLVSSSPAYQQAAPVAVPAEASADDAPQMSADTEPEIAWRDGWNSCRDAMLAAAPAAQEPVAWQDPENEDRICSARQMREARRVGGATLTALKPLSHPLYAATPAVEQPHGTTSDKIRAELYDEALAELGAVRRILTDDDMRRLRRFQEICEDSDADGHDLPKEAVRRLERAGALRSCGFGRHEVTAFGDYLLCLEGEA